MAPRGIEVLVAIRRDGLVPVLVLGAGGVHTERLDDVAVIPLPADARRIEQALADAPHADPGAARSSSSPFSSSSCRTR